MELLDGKYQIEQLLGQGGMGAVYRATHLGTKRTVAVKVIHPQLLTNNHQLVRDKQQLSTDNDQLFDNTQQLSTNNEFVARFRREAEAAGRLRHPNVVDVTDFGFAQTTRGPVAYLVMEYLDGCTLAEILEEEGALPIGWAIDILEQVCSAVEEAHRAGIIHRDLKPDNIWLEPNRRGGYTVKVLDFGLVKLGEPDATPPKPSIAELILPAAEAETLLRSTSEEQTLLNTSDRAEAFEAHKSSIKTNGSDPSLKGRTTQQQLHDENLTRLGSVMGTPFYMSPEQCRGERLTPSSDIYSLGVVAYRMITGETPFKGTNEELIELHQTAEPPPIREKNRKISRKTAQIVMSALEKDPTKRPQSSAAGFASALRASWEGPGNLLRQAFSLYSEHFPTFVQISLLGYAPLIVLLAFGAFSDTFIDMSQFSQMQLMAYGILLLGALVISLLVAYFFVSAATVPVVVQLMVAPLRKVRIRTAFAALRKRWVLFATTSIIVMSMILLGTAAFVVPGLIVAIVYALYAPVAIMEQGGVRATLRRSQTLSFRALPTVLIITVVQFALPILVWRAAVTTDLTFSLNDDFSPRQFGFNVSMSARSSLYQLLNVFVTPLTAIMISLLYLKTRRAGGESLRDTSEQFEELDIPRSRWQARMRSRQEHEDE